MVLTRAMLKTASAIPEPSAEISENEVEKLKDEIEQLKRELRNERRDRSGSDRSRRQIKHLEEQHARDKARITVYKKQLATKELEADAEELVGDGASSSSSGTERSDLMRRLLRRFCDLMVVTTMESDKYDCPVCLETMAFTKFLSFPCEHSICSICLPSLVSELGNVSCPTCRGVSPREELERVTCTEVGRWDALLEVAKEWAKVDVKDVDESTEGGFMDDEEESASGKGEENSTSGDDNRSSLVGVTQSQALEGKIQDRQQSPGIRATTPPSNPALYSQLTPQQKKRRMEDIIRERRQKGR